MSYLHSHLHTIASLHLTTSTDRPSLLQKVVDVCGKQLGLLHCREVSTLVLSVTPLVLFTLFHCRWAHLGVIAIPDKVTRLSGPSSRRRGNLFRETGESSGLGDMLSR